MLMSVLTKTHRVTQGTLYTMQAVPDGEGWHVVITSIDNGGGAEVVSEGFARRVFIETTGMDGADKGRLILQTK
jgi:hypothetical protein